MKQYDNILLVTGGAGFIGSAFLRMFVPKYSNWLFINLDALTYAGDLKKLVSVEDYENYKFFHGNICDRELVEKLFDNYQVNIVLNFAAESHVDNSIKDSNKFIKTNILGTHCLLDVALRYWSEISMKKKSIFIQISTDEVYGSLSMNDHPSNESDPLLPNSPYSSSKAAAELVCRSYFKTFELPVIITRSSNNYGPYQNSEKLIPKIIINALNNIKIPIYGDGYNVRDWIYVEDNCDAILEIILRGTIGEIYNIGGGNELTNNKIVDLILRKLDKSSELIVYVEDRLGHDFRYSLNYQKITRLGWKKKTAFDLGIETTIKHYTL